MKIPVVLPVVHVAIDDAGSLTVDLDGEPYDAGRALGRDDLQTVLDTITGESATAVRVELRESDGTTYADIATPADSNEPSDKLPETPTAPVRSMSRISGTGFRPGEAVAIAYVLVRETADADGGAALHLPLAALAGRSAAMVLLGLDSKVATLVEGSA